MKSGNISHEIIKTISSYFSCAVKVDAIELFHDFCVIGNLKIRNKRLTVLLHLDIFCVILADWNARINDIRNRHHDLGHFIAQLFFAFRKLLQGLSLCIDLLFDLLCLRLFSLSHQGADLLGEFIPLCPETVRLLLRLSRLCI